MKAFEPFANRPISIHLLSMPQCSLFNKGDQIYTTEYHSIVLTLIIRFVLSGYLTQVNITLNWERKQNLLFAISLPP